MASARRVYGDELDALFGTLAPTPPARIRAVERTGVVDLGGGRRLESHHSPGHARHHVGLIDSVSGELSTKILNAVLPAGVVATEVAQ